MRTPAQIDNDLTMLVDELDSNDINWVEYNYDRTLRLDGLFTIDQLKAIIATVEKPAD